MCGMALVATGCKFLLGMEDACACSNNCTKHISTSVVHMLTLSNCKMFTNILAGCLYTDEELKELSEVMRKYRMVVISDEIYSHLTFSDNYVSISKVRE